MSTPNVDSKWLGVDWSRNINDIAEDMGVTRQRAYQVRAELGIPSEPRATLADAVMSELEHMDVTDMTTTEIHEELSRRGVDLTIEQLRIVLSRKGVKRIRDAVGTIAKWVRSNDTSKYTINEAAELIGATPESVRSHYAYHKLPYRSAEALSTRRSYDWDLVTDWTAPAKEISAITGAPLQAVYNRRSYLRRRGELE